MPDPTGVDAVNTDVLDSMPLAGRGWWLRADAHRQIAEPQSQPVGVALLSIIRPHVLEVDCIDALLQIRRELEITRKRQTTA